MCDKFWSQHTSFWSEDVSNEHSTRLVTYYKKLVVPLPEWQSCNGRQDCPEWEMAASWWYPTTPWSALGLWMAVCPTPRSVVPWGSSLCKWLCHSKRPALSGFLLVNPVLSHSCPLEMCTISPAFWYQRKQLNGSGMEMVQINEKWGRKLQLYQDVSTP
jgi:hypothetical protein